MQIPGSLSPSWFDRFVLRWLPRSLELQVALLTVGCLVLSILGAGYITARQQTDAARNTVSAQIQALAHNLATVNAYFLRTNDADQIEKLTLQTATVAGIYSVLVTDLSGLPISEVINKNGIWSPHFSLTRVPVPAATGSGALLETLPATHTAHDFLAGTGGTLSAWRRIDDGAQALGWVRVNYRLDAFDTVAASIRLQALKSMSLAIIVTLLLLWLLLRPSMRALRQATAFAAQLDTAMGARLTVSRRAAEIESLGHALNVVSARLQIQHLDLNNQKFALDQHAIVSITNLQGTIIYANQLFCDISGFSQEELLGQNHRLVKSDAHPPEFFQALWSTISQGQVWHGDIKNRKKDGGFYWVNATIVPLPGVDGLPHQFIGIRTDITASKTLEHSLQLAKDDAERAAQSKGQFLANMSHEIRTPMNAILGMLRLLQNTDLNKRQLDYASKAEGAAQSLLGLLNDILDFSKMDAGKMTLESHPFRLDKLLRDLSVIVSANLGQKPVEVLFDIDPTMPHTLLGDAMRLQQVLINLCGNAVKFTDTGEVVVKITPLAQSATHATLRFGVHDSGIGIAPENQRHIFDGFSQAEASTTRRFGGTGLGLSISRRLVALMGGDLRLQSELGKGSTFSFDLELPLGQLTEPEDPVPLHHKLAAHLRVLVVDDNRTARDIMAAMCTSLGWQVDTAASGALALERMQASRTGQAYQAIFVDWLMPGMDGWDTVKALTQLAGQDPSQPSPVMIMVSASGREMLTERPPEERTLLHQFLVKPITASMLLDAVSDALASRNQAHANPDTPTRNLPLQGLRLLVVEDNIINQQVAQEMLGNEGASVVLADNGQEGVDAVRQAMTDGQPFDVVLMDLQMPVMDGYAATRVLRHDLGLHDLPIIAMTANAMASDREACLAAGMNAHVGKPFQLLQLVSLIQNPPPLASATAGAALPAPVPQRAGRLPVAPNAPPASITLPPVDTVDSSAALERLGSNPALYSRVIESFLLEIDRLPEQFDASLQAADLVTTERLLHTLKGVASTVGASYMAAVARKAELCVKDARSLGLPLNTRALAAELRTALANTRTVMQRVAHSYQAQAPQSTAAPAAPHPADLGKLRELLALLQASDMRALEVYEQLRPGHAGDPAPAWQQLDNAMRAFDFLAAMQAVALLQAPAPSAPQAL